MRAGGAGEWWEVAVKGEEQSCKSEEGREENGREQHTGRAVGGVRATKQINQASGVGPLRLAAEAMTGLAGKALERSAAAAEKAP